VILVYQMAKVASRSWLAAASGLGTGEDTVHVHFLREENLERIAAALAVPPPRQTVANMVLPRNLGDNGRRSRQKLADARLRREPIRIICGMRDPVARSVSLLIFMAYFYGHQQRPLNPRSQMDPAYVIATLEQLWLRVLENEEPKDSFDWLTWFIAGAYRWWFENELRPSLGFDIYAEPFEPANGAQFQSFGDAQLLAYRVEDMSTGAASGPALLASASRFLDAPIELPVANAASGRRSRELHTRVLGGFRLPRDRLDQIYDCASVRHFYSESEIAAFKLRWAG